MQNRFILTPFFLDEASPELESLARPDWHINKPVLSDGDRQRRMSTIHLPIAEFVARALAHGERPVSVAGDCCATLGVLAGLQTAGLEPVLVWLDAHGDFNTWETTPSGFLGGMPLAMLVGRGEQTMANAVGLRRLPEDRVVLSDGRALDSQEREALVQSAVHHVADARLLPGHPLLSNPLYIHFDTDIVSPGDAPAMRYPAPGGPTSAELRAVFQPLARRRQIVAVSMTTWTPQLDEDGRSQATCMRLLHALIDRG